MARVKNGKQYQKQPPQQIQQQSIQKNIKKIKQAPSEERIIERKPSPNLLLDKRTRKEQQQQQSQSVKKKIKQPYSIDLIQIIKDSGFYPDVPNLQFPNQLLDCLIKVICSFGNNAKLNQIIKNLALFYTNEVQEEIVNLVLAESEETGVIYELEGKFKVTNTLIQKPLLQKNDQLGQKMKHEDIEDNDQFHSLSNNHAQQDQEIEDELNQFRQYN